MKPKTKSMTGKEYWRNLEALEGTPELDAFLDQNIPGGAQLQNHTMSRRNFLSLMGASLALAGLAGCRRPVEKIIPYVVPPEDLIPGVPHFYASTMPFGLEAWGVLVENHEGRPTKLEGNELHPSTRGASNAFLQAAILGLYDPDRSDSLLHNGQKSNWKEFSSAWETLYAEYTASRGEGLAVFSEASTSPTLIRLKKEFKTKFPKADWVTYEPVSDENIYNGMQRVTGRKLRPVYRFDKARVILSLEADFLHMESNNIANSLGFSKGRNVVSERDGMNRLYVVESSFSVTGGMADHRLRLQSGLIAPFTAALARELKRQGLSITGLSNLPSDSGRFDQQWLQVVAKDLMANGGRSILLAGRNQPAPVHALVYAINAALGNHKTTCRYAPLSNLNYPDREGVNQLVQRMRTGQVSTLVILGGNPVYNLPADLNFKAALKQVSHSIHLSSYVDETSVATEWHIPEAHFLEAWGDAQSVEGIPSVIQPQIQPLFGGYSAIEVLSLLTTGQRVDSFDLVRETWKKRVPGPGFEKRWQKILHDGLFQPGKKSLSAPAVQSKSLAEVVASDVFTYQEADLNNLEIVFSPSRSVFDGRFANNGWLQELPDPITKLTWDNAALISKTTARSLGVKSGDLVALNYRKRSLTLPVWVLPGQADFTVTLPLGYGRDFKGYVGGSVGFNGYVLRTSGAMEFDRSLSLTPTGETYALASTQDHGGLEAEKLATEEIESRLPVLIRETELQEYQRHPDFVKEYEEHPPLKSLWEERPYDQGYQWGMTIDLNKCTGCNACTIACQSENNIPVVGKLEVSRGREMHWLRLDRYFNGTEDDPELVYQPVACQHCENAPCEQVCPVAATTHDKEGLNVMVYNRCVGTRYCANNCPYKVRRFNFFNYTKDTPEIVKMVMNPDVTVRSRGVMEKCTFCIQRISFARISAKKENREIRDGEVVSACQQSCPADAIVFGNINDPESQISRIKEQNRNYALLGELNTKPRTTYLAKLRNPNPELEAVEAS
ncbi:MAG: TAT-variant-translocated molybdopterin oxidoreductase [Fidelibacterota bacterium]